MDVEINPQPNSKSELLTEEIIETTNPILTDIMQCLVNNKDIFFKSQQRDEEDLSNAEKRAIANEIFEKSKSKFLNRFGRYIKIEHLEYFKSYQSDLNEGYAIAHQIQFLQRYLSRNSHHTDVRNRRYAALKHLVQEDSYFSENEMMKRNPLLYDQLVGQFLSEQEKKDRDRIGLDSNNKSFVSILMEGIERDDAECKRNSQENAENDIMEEDSDDELKPKYEPPVVRWGDIPDDPSTSKKRSSRTFQKNVTHAERELLKDEFISSMYESFLDGEDVDFDYNAIDNNDEYDNLEILDKDEEERYFDSEEPDDVEMDNGEIKVKEESSEDELDIYMSALNDYPSVTKLSKELEKL